MKTMMISQVGRRLAIVVAICSCMIWPAFSFSPPPSCPLIIRSHHNVVDVPRCELFVDTTRCSQLGRISSLHGGRDGSINRSSQFHSSSSWSGRHTTSLQMVSPTSSASKKRKITDLVAAVNHRKFIFSAAALLLSLFGAPSSCTASNILSNIPSRGDIQSSLVTLLDRLAHSGINGMIIYTLSFMIWTITIGVTTPIETAAGMAFPLRRAIPLSAMGKIGGAFVQYTLAKYLFRDYARKKMKDNKWMSKIEASFKHHPYRVALIWRFSPLPEFVKNIGPALVPTLRTPYQILAILSHGLPFTLLWSVIGNEAAVVARGVRVQLLSFLCMNIVNEFAKSFCIVVNILL